MTDSTSNTTRPQRKIEGFGACNRMMVLAPYYAGRYGVRMIRYAIIPTADREAAFWACFDAIRPQVDWVIAVSHHADYLVPCIGVSSMDVLAFTPEPVNISAMWNLGIDHAAEHSNGAPYRVAVLNDDAVVPAGWFDNVDAAMTHHGAAAGSYGGVTTEVVWRKPMAVNLYHRMQGFAFILDGAKGIRADENMRWWLSDDAIDWDARTKGGTVVIPGVVKHPANGGTPVVGELADWFKQDRAKFISKWGASPV